jgi:hypothetical protein
MSRTTEASAVEDVAADVTIHENIETVTSPDLLKASARMRIRVEGTTAELDVLQISHTEFVQLHRTGSTQFPQESTTGRHIWETPAAAKRARLNRKHRGGSSGSGRSAIRISDGDTSRPSWADLYAASEHGVTLE